MSSGGGIPSEVDAIQRAYRDFKPNIDWCDTHKAELKKGGVGCAITALSIILIGLVVTILAKAHAIPADVALYVSMIAFSLPVLVLIAMSCYHKKIGEKINEVQTFVNDLKTNGEALLDHSAIE